MHVPFPLNTETCNYLNPQLNPVYKSKPRMSLKRQISQRTN